ncbi:MAG TPA: DNA-binding transcriptional regulator [Pirellulales bacterium]|jgi:LacI family transcriptional regulator|nr:DNA-binding transcriptional regulator [Pirellulales bacterium]
MAKRPHVALLIETSNSYARGLLRGVYAYLREHRPWSIYLPEQGRGDAPPNWLKSWHGDGIIARIENSRIAKAVRETGAPAVDVSAARLMPELPCIETDNEAITRLAFEHLFERGFRNLAYCGDDRFQWSVERALWFGEMAREAGCSLAVYPHADRRRAAAASWEQEEKELMAWLRHLPKPCGMMACYDIRGRQVLDVCRRGGVKVPDELAVVGVDNDDLLCNLTDPPLTSVAPDTHRTGFEAAELLDQLMAGRKVAGGLCRIKPTGIVTRQSTDVLATADAEVSSAVRFIRDHACDGIKVEDVLKIVPISRRILESRFKRMLGHTPHEEILRVQLQRVRQLLEETDLSLAAIADRAGFKYVEYLSVVFKRHFHQPPSHYRAEHRSS